MKRWCTRVFDMLKVVRMVATNCMKMNWKGLGTANETNMTANTWMANARRKLKNALIMMARMLTGMIKISDGLNLQIQYDGMTTSNTKTNRNTTLRNSENIFLCNLLTYKPISVKIRATRNNCVNRIRRVSSRDMERFLYSRCNDSNIL